MDWWLWHGRRCRHTLYIRRVTCRAAHFESWFLPVKINHHGRREGGAMRDDFSMALKSFGISCMMNHESNREKNDDEMKTKMSGIVSCMSIFVLSKSLLLQPVGVNVPFYLSNGTVAFSPIPTLSLKLKGNCPILSQLKSLGHFAINIFLLFMGRCGAFMVFRSTRRTVIIIM